MNQHRLVRTFSAALAVSAFLIAAPQAALAADPTPDIPVPQNAQSVWVDIETPSAAELTFTGSLNNNGTATDLEFKPSPSGATAITDVDAGTAQLTLSASDSTDVSVSVTFVDDNDVVLAESTTPVTLEPVAAPVEPSDPTSPDDQNHNVVAGTVSSDASSPKDNDAKRPSAPQTGSAIAIVAIAAVALSVIGLVLLRVKKGARR